MKEKKYNFRIMKDGFDMFYLEFQSKDRAEYEKNSWMPCKPIEWNDKGYMDFVDKNLVFDNIEEAIECAKKYENHVNKCSIPRKEVWRNTDE